MSANQWSSIRKVAFLTHLTKVKGVLYRGRSGKIFLSCNPTNFQFFQSMAPKVIIQKRVEAIPMQSVSEVKVLALDSEEYQGKAPRQTAFFCLSLKASTYLAMILACVGTFSTNLIAGGVYTTIAIIAMCRKSTALLNLFASLMMLSVIATLGISIYSAVLIANGETLDEFLPFVIHLYRLAGVCMLLAGAYINGYFAFVIRKYVAELRSEQSSKIKRHEGIQILSV